MERLKEFPVVRVKSRTKPQTYIMKKVKKEIIFGIAKNGVIATKKSYKFRYGMKNWYIAKFYTWIHEMER